jgi:hypothetical protein
MSGDLTAPVLSVVVVSFNEISQLERCLRSLAAQAAPPDTEVIVIRKWDQDTGDLAVMKTAFPETIWVNATDGTIPRMRSRGIAESRGEVVALIEDDCVVDTHFGAALLRAHASPHIAVGGAVEPGSYQTALDWATYFCDYARFMLPFPAGETSVLPGNNVSYKRAVVQELLSLGAADGLQEAFVHAAWSRSGRLMKADPQVVVRNENSWTVAAVSSLPFHHGRAFAGQRGQSWPLPRRLAFAAAAVGLPVLHAGRILIRVVARRRRVGQLARALPWVAVFGLSWSAGECVGYALGPGTSLLRWR